MNKKVMYRQGDVLIMRVDDNVDTSQLKKVEPVDGRFILADGEATGHAHAISMNGCSMFADAEGGLLLDISRPKHVMHEEHARIDLGPGKYTVRRQREYVAGRIQNVAD